MSKFIVVLIMLLPTACKLNQHTSGGGSGGNVPSSEELNRYFDQVLSAEKDDECSDITVDEKLEKRRFPIIKKNGDNEWPDKWSEHIEEQFFKESMRPLREQAINEDDLEFIGCPNYNKATMAEKAKFWELFLSSTAYRESDFGYNQEYKGNIGLLQISADSASLWCTDLLADFGEKRVTNSLLANPKFNLQCGLKIFQFQITGVPLKNRSGKIRQTKPALTGRLFTQSPPKHFYWEVLFSDQKYNVVNWFKALPKGNFHFVMNDLQP